MTCTTGSWSQSKSNKATFGGILQLDLLNSWSISNLKLIVYWYFNKILSKQRTGRLTSFFKNLFISLFHNKLISIFIKTLKWFLTKSWVSFFKLSGKETWIFHKRSNWREPSSYFLQIKFSPMFSGIMREQWFSPIDQNTIFSGESIITY